MLSKREAIPANLYDDDAPNPAKDIESIFNVTLMLHRKEQRLDTQMVDLLNDKLLAYAKINLHEARNLCRRLQDRTHVSDLLITLQKREEFFTHLLAPHEESHITALTKKDLEFVLCQTFADATNPLYAQHIPLLGNNAATCINKSLFMFVATKEGDKYCQIVDNAILSLRHLEYKNPKGKLLSDVMKPRIDDHFAQNAIELFHSTTQKNVRRMSPWEIIPNPVLKHTVRILVNTDDTNTRRKAGFALRTIFDYLQKENPKAFGWVISQYYLGNGPSPHLAAITDQYRPWKMLSRPEKIQRCRDMINRMLTR